MEEKKVVHKKKFKKKYLFFLAIILFMGSIGFVNYEFLDMVRNSTPYHQTSTLGDYYKQAFGSTTWLEDKISDDKALVRIKGECSLNGENKSFVVTYKISDATYAFESLALDDVKQNTGVAFEFLQQLQHLGQL